MRQRKVDFKDSIKALASNTGVNITIHPLSPHQSLLFVNLVCHLISTSFLGQYSSLISGSLTTKARKAVCTAAS